jgi:hypothetical protein
MVIYESRLEDVCERFPHLSRERLEQAVRWQHFKWIKANRRTTSLPPKA